MAKRNPSIVIEARSSSLSLAESNESNGAAAAVVQRHEELNNGHFGVCGTAPLFHHHYGQHNT